MRKKADYLKWKKAVTLLEIAAAVGFFLAAAAGLLFWRVSASPLDMAFAKSYIEDSLGNRGRGISTQLGSLVLHWPDLAGPLLLDVRGVRIYGPDKSVIVDVDEASISLSKAALLIGQVRPVGLILKHPELTVIRAKDGSLNVGFGEAQKPKDVESQTALTEQILGHIARPGNEAGSPLATLKSFEIVDAQVNFEDMAADTSSFLPQVDVVFQSTAEGLDADMYVAFDDTPEWPSHLRASLLIPWEKSEPVLDASLENFDLSFLADKIPALSVLDGQDVEVDGRLYAVLDKNFRPVHAQLTANSAGGALRLPEMADEPIPYNDFSFEMDYDGVSGKMTLAKTQITLRDVTLNAEADLNVKDSTLGGQLKLSIAEMKQAQIKPLWPKFLEGDNAEEWIVQRMSEGTFRDVWAALDLFAVRGPEGWDYGVRDAYAAFAFENMAVDYRAPLTPVKKAKGQGKFKLSEEKLAIEIEEGSIGALKVEKADLEFVNIIERGKGKADLRIKVAGPLKSGLDYLSLEPVALKHKFDLAKVKGEAKATVNIAFPTHKDIKVKDVKVNAEGVLSDVTLPGVMKSLTLSGGPLDFSVKDNLFHLSGNAKIEGQAAKLDYREFLDSDGQEYKSKVTVSGVASEAIRKGLGMDLNDFLSGDAGVAAVYTEYAGGKAVADVEVDLSPASVYFEPFGYEKKPGVAGSATVKATLQDGALRSVTGLQAKAAGMEIKNADFSFRGKDSTLAGGNIPAFVAGETVGKLKFDVSEAGKYNITLDGSFLDLRPLLEGEQDDEAYDQPAMKIAVTADRMRAAEEDTIQHAKVNVDIDGDGHFNFLEMNGVAGEGDFFIAYRPGGADKNVFRMQAQDAGATLRAFGVYENIVGGKLDIVGELVKGVNDRNVRGVAQITDFKVVRAPTLARLIGMLSLPGVLSILKDDGLGFSKLEANFDWLYRPKGSLLKVRDGRTSGNSLGFTFDGTYDKSKSVIDVEGTMIPLSGVNKFIGNIPLVGDILTGGSGGIFAATYSVKGDAKNPQVFVNPLSVLTPGILRRILFEQN